MKIGSIAIDCREFDKMLAFWQEALHYVPREPAKDGWVVLRDPDGRNPNVSLNRVHKKRLGRNRLHLDLYTDNRDDEVKRLLKIGATRHLQKYEPDDDFRVLEDPSLCMNARARRLYFFLFAFLAHWALQYLLLLSNVVKTFPQIEHFF